MKRSTKKLTMIGSLCTAAVLCLTACDNNRGGSAGDTLERTGDRIEDATDDARDALRHRDRTVITTNDQHSVDRTLNNAGDETKDAARDVGRKLDRAGEDIQDKANDASR